MIAPGRHCRGGFTLVELLSAVLVFSLLALMSYRGLGAVLDAREHAARETEKWRQVSAFLARFESDVQMAAPRPVRRSGGVAPAWSASADAGAGAALEFTRFAADAGGETPRRLGYRLNPQREVELLLWPGLDTAPNAEPARHAVLKGVASLELSYLDADLAWIPRWPGSPRDAEIPRAVRLRVVLASGEDIVRVFALRS